MNPAIVINAYNRPDSLRCLLRSIESAWVPEGVDIPLVISLDDASNHPEVVSTAHQFGWSHGTKEILCREKRLGMRSHFYACGDLSRQYGSIIYLEDDLLVSPVFYAYASQALEFYRDDPQIAGVSLYGLWFNGYTQFPFVPLLDEADAYFIQVPYTQGEAFTGEQWTHFRLWLDAGAALPDHIPIHESWSRFPSDEWFPDWARYLAAVGKYFVYPRGSLSTGAGDAGAHFSQSTAFFQVPLQQSKLNYTFKNLEDSLAVYDPFFELLPSRMDRLTGAFQGYDYTVDLHGTRSQRNIPASYVLTTRPCKRSIFSYAKTMWPLEANIVYSLPGQGISFCEKGDLDWSWQADWVTRESNRTYYSRGRSPGLKGWLRSRLAKWLASRYFTTRS